MDLNLAGRTVLITGGSKGIGLACAEAFAAEGARVAISSRAPDNLAAGKNALQAKGHDVTTIVADLTDPKSAVALIAEVERSVGAIDVLVNCAGAAKRYAPSDLDMQAWHNAMDSKYFTYVHAMQAVLPLMAARKRGAIVNIVGQGGKVANPSHLPGGSANAALMLVSAGLASAFGRQGIRVNAINPGVTLSERAKAGHAAEAKTLGISEEEARRLGEQKIPLGRYARPEEIAAVAVFLASDRASYITGAVIPMDGAATATVV
ncbi:MAG TPA: SDR family oxidoreductase [Burkholderiales bacterium]|nr:SDR family oxidoreductase [Burkholderiales bacterium]